MFCRGELLFFFLSVGRISNALHGAESLDATDLPVAGLSVFSSRCMVQC